MESNLTAAALNVATAAALEAGKVFSQNIIQLDRVKVNTKAGNRNRVELVSEIALIAERTIIEYLDSSYPDFNVVSEKAGNLGRKSEFCWLIDALNGADNYSHSHPHGCVSIALTHQNEPVIAVVYDALRNELFSARFELPKPVDYLMPC